MKWVKRGDKFGTLLLLNGSVQVGCYNCWFQRVMRWFKELG